MSSPPMGIMFRLKDFYGGSCSTGFFIGETYVFNLYYEEVSEYAFGERVYAVDTCQFCKRLADHSRSEKKKVPASPFKEES